MVLPRSSRFHPKSNVLSFWLRFQKNSFLRALELSVFRLVRAHFETSIFIFLGRTLSSVEKLENYGFFAS